MGGGRTPSSRQVYRRGGGRGNLRRRCGTTTRYTTLPSDWVEQSDLVIVAAVGDLRGVDGRRRPSPSFLLLFLGGRWEEKGGLLLAPSRLLHSLLFRRFTAGDQKGEVWPHFPWRLFFCPGRHHNASIFFFPPPDQALFLPVSHLSLTYSVFARFFSHGDKVFFSSCNIQRTTLW